MTAKLLMGNEAFAHAALEAGVRVVAGYPGTPSSELIETVARLRRAGDAHDVYVEWAVNEKAALEVAFGASLSGARALFTCKQVGLNVASDALMSLNYVGTRAGLVLFVADDPGPISSQTEQDTRRFASFAKVPVFDPATPEQGFEMMKLAFELSEAYHTPVIVRPTTRINHASTFIDVADETIANPLEDGGFIRNPDDYVIFPKRAYAAHGQINKRLQSITHDFSFDPQISRYNAIRVGARTYYGADAQELERPSANAPTLGIIAGGVSVQYALEALDLITEEADAVGIEVPRYKFMQIGTPYPFPRRAAKIFLKDLTDVLVLEELDAVIEEELLELGGSSFLAPRIHGKTTGSTNRRGENSTEICAEAIAHFFDEYVIQMAKKTSVRPQILFEVLVERKIGPSTLLTYDKQLPVRPPVLCAGCPHRGSFYAVNNALRKLKIDRDDAIFCGDIGCYTLGNTAPLDAVDTCLCMGGGITMAQGIAAADPSKKAIAFVGDSTFFASGMTGIANAIYNNHDITLCILDNSTTAMTGMQPHPGTGQTLMGHRGEPMRVENLLYAMGLTDVLFTNPLDKEDAEIVTAMALEIKGPSAVIFRSPCVWLKEFGTPAFVNVDTCTGCKKCITEIGCPAIWFNPKARGPKSGHRGQAVIDRGQCNGCGLCMQICPFSAIVARKEVEAEKAPIIKRSRLNQTGIPTRKARFAEIEEIGDAKQPVEEILEPLDPIDPEEVETQANVPLGDGFDDTTDTFGASTERQVVTRKYSMKMRKVASEDDHDVPTGNAASIREASSQGNPSGSLITLEDSFASLIDADPIAELLLEEETALSELEDAAQQEAPDEPSHEGSETEPDADDAVFGGMFFLELDDGEDERAAKQRAKAKAARERAAARRAEEDAAVRAAAQAEPDRNDDEPQDDPSSDEASKKPKIQRSRLNTSRAAMGEFGDD